MSSKGKKVISVVVIVALVAVVAWAQTAFSVRPDGAVQVEGDLYVGGEIRKAASGGTYGAVVPVGTIVAFGGTVPPAGWFLCNGAVKNVSAYPELAQVLGTSFNGPNDTNAAKFRLPDLRGVFIRGAGTNDLDTNPPANRITKDFGTAFKDATGANYNGYTVGSVLNDQFQGHSHRIQYHSAWAAGGSNRGTFHGNATSTTEVREPVTWPGDGTPRYGKETRPASVSVTYIIKY